RARSTRNCSPSREKPVNAEVEAVAAVADAVAGLTWASPSLAFAFPDDLCRLRGLLLERVVEVAIAARFGSSPGRHVVARDIGQAVVRPLTDMSQLMGKLRLVELAPGEDPAPDRDGDPVGQHEALHRRLQPR